MGARPLLSSGALALVAALVALPALPSGARAYEDQLTLGVDLGYALATTDGPQGPHGFTFGLEASVGLGDLFSLRGRIGYSQHPVGEVLHVGSAGLEVIYLLDVMEWVPYFGVGADAFVFASVDGHRFDPGLHAVVGIEWLASRKWLMGLDLRPYVLPLAFRHEPLNPVYFTMTLRLSLIFDL
jgi:hypothetical protein